MASIVEPKREDGKGFASFIWRAYPLTRVGRGGAYAWGDQSGKYRLDTYADEAQSPFLAVDPPGSVRRPQGPFRFIRQCFGVVGELTAVLAVLVTIMVLFSIDIRSRIKFKTPRPTETTVIGPGPVRPESPQNTAPNAAATPTPGNSTPLFDQTRPPQTRQQPAGTPDKVPNRAAEPAKANPKSNSDLKADTPAVKRN
jgi:hypothetical protein